MTEYSFEYQVFERGSTSQSKWWAHGGIHTDKADALKDLHSKRGTYSRHGRVFRLQRRLLSSWERVPA